MRPKKKNQCRIAFVLAALLSLVLLPISSSYALITDMVLDKTVVYAGEESRITITSTQNPVNGHIGELVDYDNSIDASKMRLETSYGSATGTLVIFSTCPVGSYDITLRVGDAHGSIDRIFTIQVLPPLPVCDPPVANPPGGSYPTFPMDVTLSCATSGATIYYTTDGSEPIYASDVYGGGISVSEGMTVKAIAVADGLTVSGVMSETYTKGESPRPPRGQLKVEYIPQPDPAVYEPATIGNCKEWVSVRSAPGTEFDVIGKAYLGESIKLIRWVYGETWCKIYFGGGGAVGWVEGKYIVPQK